MNEVECLACGEVPTLRESGGELIVACDCELGLAIDSSEEATVAPDGWTESV